MIGVYALNRIELLRDVFVWAYARSCQQYVAVKQNLVPPDIFRLRYRQARDEAATDASVRARTPHPAAEADKGHFIAPVHAEFKHCMRAMRFASELAHWSSRRGGKGRGSAKRLRRACSDKFSSQISL